MSATCFERLFLVGLLAAGCRFGGPSGDPTAGAQGPPSDASVDEQEPSPPDAPPEAITSEAEEPPEIPESSDLDVWTAPSEAGCGAPFEVAVCDPVCNSGCPALTRCDVSETPRAGKCIGIWIAPEGSACLRTDVTDPCAAGTSCVGGICRRLCYADADCSAPGTCCNVPVEAGGAPSGFKACTPCS
jgi:hypothetical protein